MNYFHEVAGVYEFKDPFIIFVNGGGGCEWKPMRQGMSGAGQWSGLP
jgi:hypothetical protein